MIDLHSHILPGIDDGAPDLDTALDMARAAIKDGIQVMACTPHITPGVYNNDADVIEEAVVALRRALEQRNLRLELVVGADVHISPNMGEYLVSGDWPRLAGTQYFLFEPPHHVMPPHLLRIADDLLEEGLVPVLTHPERLSWIDGHYEVIGALRELGVLLQLTAGSLTGDFGSTVKSWADRMLADGYVDLLATDTHDAKARPPVLSRARDYVAQRYGDEVATGLVEHNPRAILDGECVNNLFAAHSSPTETTSWPAPSLWQRVSEFAKRQTVERIGHQP
ncbi:MAG: CpsB/CapC family capsule biosynthesis tyrosine phosphatase [Pseudomonadota bacterium]